MSVGRRLLLSLAALVACTALLGCAAHFGLQSLLSRYEAAEEQYAELRSVYEIGHRAATARTLLGAQAPSEAVERQLQLALAEIEKLPASESIAAMSASLREAIQGSAAGDGGGGGAATTKSKLSAALAQVGSCAAQVQASILENRRRTTRELEIVRNELLTLFGVTLVLAIGVGVAQFRSVMRPLRTLDGAAREMTGARLDLRVRETGDREFRRLIRQFNAMSASIERLHASLKDDVETKSRQLIRSEQLASLGRLAAGLAHEINNPLGIIAGHAQASLRRLERSAAGGGAGREEAVRKAEHTLRIVVEEAFRGRDIAVRLLRMTEPSEGAAHPVAIVDLTRRALELVGHLPAARGREMRLAIDAPGHDPICMGQAPELLQVLINLLTNALEACPPEGGCVVVSIEARDSTVAVSVEDNGCGMDAGTLAHAFEPFFTDKPRRGLQGWGGCGLGLSVSHAIVERHGGCLYARSAGANQGSTFTIELPVVEAQPIDTEARHAGSA